MGGLSTRLLLRHGAKEFLSPATGWAAKSAWAKMCDITGTQIWLGLNALPIPSKLVEEAEPITYKSKLQEAERYSYYYKCLSASSTGVGVGSVVTGGTFAPLTRIIGYITTGIGLFTGVKGIYETHQKIKYYSGMLKEASETVYFTTSEIEGFTYYTLTNKQGLDCLRQYKYIQGFHPEFISNPLTWTPKLLQVNGNFIEGSKTVVQNYLQAMYVLRNIKGDTEHYTPDLCRSRAVPSLNQIVLNKLEEEFSPALVEEAQKLTDIDQYIDNHLKSYQGSLWYKGAWNKETAIINKREKLEEKVTTLQKIK